MLPKAPGGRGEAGGAKAAGGLRGRMVIFGAQALPIFQI